MVTDDIFHLRLSDSVGESKDIVNDAEQKYSSCSLLDEDDWHEFTSGTRFNSQYLYPSLCFVLHYYCLS